MNPTLKPALITIILMLGLTSPTAAGPLEAAAAADEKGDYATALQLLRPLAEQGNARAHAPAQNYLGLVYDDGNGVPRSAEARRYK